MDKVSENPHMRYFNISRGNALRPVGEETVKTGIEGLDAILGGGFPKGRTILLLGGPGTGKTTLSLQYLYNGAVTYGENGIYVTLQESLEHIHKDMLKLGLDFEVLEDEDRFRMIDFSASNYLSSLTSIVGIAAGDYTQMERSEEVADKFNKLLKSIKEEAREMGAKRIVIDPITGLVFQEPDPVKRRIDIHRLFYLLEETGCTSIIVSEARGSNMNRRFQTEEYFAHGVMLLQNFEERGTIIRGISIEKMRGMAHELQPNPYQITGKGIVIFPGEKIFSSNM